MCVYVDYVVTNILFHVHIHTDTHINMYVVIRFGALFILRMLTIYLADPLYAVVALSGQS